MTLRYDLLTSSTNLSFTKTLGSHPWVTAGANASIVANQFWKLDQWEIDSAMVGTKGSSRRRFRHYKADQEYVRVSDTVRRNKKAAAVTLGMNI